MGLHNPPVLQQRHALQINVTNKTNLCLIKKAFFEKGLVRPRNAMLIFRVYDHKTLIIQQKPKRKKDETKEDLFSALLH